MKTKLLFVWAHLWHKFGPFCSFVSESNQNWSHQDRKSLFGAGGEFFFLPKTGWHHFRKSWLRVEKRIRTFRLVPFWFDTCQKKSPNLSLPQKSFCCGLGSWSTWQNKLFETHWSMQLLWFCINSTSFGVILLRTGSLGSSLKLIDKFLYSNSKNWYISRLLKVN